MRAMKPNNYHILRVQVGSGGPQASQAHDVEH
jgi:hypothetical protein